MTHNHRPFPDEDAETIRHRMRQVRGRLREDVDEIASATKSLTDWRTYFRQYPWLALGGAAVVGYMVIPKRKPATSADFGALAELIARQKPATRSASLTSSLLATLAGIATRQAIKAVEGYISHRRQTRQEPQPEPTPTADKGTTYGYPPS